MLEHFQHWEICASLDGVGEIGEYVRTGLNYNTFVDNFRTGLQRSRYPRQMRLDFTLTLPGILSIPAITNLADTLDCNLLSKVIFAFSPDILLSPLALPRDILHEEIDKALLQIQPNPNTQSMVEVLTHLKTRPTFAEEYPDTYAEAAKRGKRHLLKLEAIRPHAKLTMEEILKESPKMLEWWRSIDV